MAQQIVMPDVGSGIEEGILLNWIKQVGDQINNGDVIAEIETDKATVEVPVTVSGTILELIGSPGQSLKVGAVIGSVGAADEKISAGEKPAAGGASAPANGGSNGAAREVAPPDAEVPTGTPTAPAASAAPATSSAPAPAAEAEPEDGNLPDGVKASPVARKIASDKGIDLKLVKGTGPNGRITKSDVEGYTPAPAAPAPAAAASAPAASGVPAANYGKFPEGADVEVIETTKMRSRIASRMVDSKQQIPHFYVTADIDVEPLLKLRSQINAGLDDARKVSVNDMIVKAVALALRDFPNINTHFYGDKLARHKRINIGIAVALPNGGLINVVAKDADKTSISAIAAQNKEMIARARENKLRPDDMQGSTFTVSNLGPYDVENFIAIVNPPEAGILAVGTAKKVPVVLADGSIGVGNRMKATVSVDHRVSDGAEGAQFLKRIKELLENPMQLLI